MKLGLKKSVGLRAAVVAGALCLGLVIGCHHVDTPDPDPQYTIDQTLSDEAQRNTIAFDGLGFLTGCLGGQSFLPPGKVADFSGFQFLRDNDPTRLGHNTSFVTIIAFNILHILSDEQVDRLVASAQEQVSFINSYAYGRFPLMDAFRRQLEGDIPSGSSGLCRDSVVAYSGRLYEIDGQVSYNRARLMGSILSSLSSNQSRALAALEEKNGIGNWDTALADPLADRQLEPDVKVAVMTYASEMYSWYAGSVEADVYFCPERQGTYFGSFYLKDWPAMGNPNYTIDEQLTARAGTTFIAALVDSQKTLVTGLVDIQRSDLNALVAAREAISRELRKFVAGSEADSATVLSLSRHYGELDGAIVYNYATHFARVGRSLSEAQKAKLTSLADSLGYVAPTGAFLYSRPIPMPEIPNTDFLFGGQ